MRNKLRRIVSFALAMVCATASASGPRFVTGRPFFTGPQGAPIGWRQTTLNYYTDAGDLSPSLHHAQADALVAAAAGVWNLSVANITVAQGGTLQEHVSGDNVYLGSAGMVWPADVLSGNATAVPLAIIYDADGSVTDTLLGAGASDPSGCRQNSVTESVDAFDPAGYILHAVIIVNGRCAGAAPEAQLELRYKLMRAFGRVLGLGWSQTNDNVFTGIPVPTSAQAMHWPIMHPIDIICGPYAYQCLPSPFVLRPDDIASMVGVYSIPAGTPLAPGKQPSQQAATGVQGSVMFPTGEGMAGVNIVVRRQPATGTIPETFYESSTVTGALFLRSRTSTFVTQDMSPWGSFGTSDAGQQGRYILPYVPLLDSGWETIITTTEPINPLYMGSYSVGPYSIGGVSPSGANAPAQTAYGAGAGSYAYADFTNTDAASSCGTGNDGTPYVPIPVPATGWWKGLLCGVGHVSYLSPSFTPGRTFTLEVTALDEQGHATTRKAMPVLAMFAPNDWPGAVPTLGVSPQAFQGLTVGTTTLRGSTTPLAGVRIGIADQRGDGRPDFAYQARLFYADQVSPARIATSGGTVTIAGLGFRPGNAVQVNGVAAAVKSWTANAIVITAPTMAEALATSGAGVDISVTDRGTGATTTITAGLTYDRNAGLPNTMRLLTAPVGNAYVGDPTSVPFAVQVLAADGLTPVTNEPIVFFSSAGSAKFGACGAPTCTVLTDASGVASSGVTPLSPDAVTVLASDGSLQQSASFNAIAQAGSMVVLSRPGDHLKVGQSSPTWFQVQVLAPDGHSPMRGRAVTFSVLAGSATYAGCAASTCTVTTDGAGMAGMPITPNAPGDITLQAADGDITAQVTFTAVLVPDVLRAFLTPSTTADIRISPGPFQVQLLQGDGVTPQHAQAVTFTASPGIVFRQCGTNTCVQMTDWSGMARVDVDVPQTGSFTFQAAFGAAVQASTVTVTEPQDHLSIVSAPSGNVTVGVASPTLFTARLLRSDGSPVVGRVITLSGPTESVYLPACRQAFCVLNLDSNGMASTAIVPLQPGPITLTAASEPLVQSVTFNAVGAAETMTVVSQPGAGGAFIDDLQTLAVKVMATGGFAPLQYRFVTFTVTGGPFSMIGSGGAVCFTSTDGNGVATCQGAAKGAGPVTIKASNDTSSVTMHFAAVAKPHIMRVVSQPADHAATGAPAATAFAVQLFSGDGVTHLPGANVTITVTNGSARFPGCASPCALTTDSNGLASLSVVPLAAGTITLLATDGTATQSVTFSAYTPTDVMRLNATPASGGFAGAPANGVFAIQLFLADGVTPASGKNVTISVTQGSASFSVCAASATCTVLTDANGLVSTSVTPLAAGVIGLLAAEGSVTQATSFSAIARPNVMTLVSAPANGAFAGDVASAPFAVRIMAPDGVTPLPNLPVTFTASGGALTFKACSAASCVILTDAQGLASTPVVPLAAATLALTATAGSLTQTATFAAVSKPDLLTLLSSPADGALVGDPATLPFALQLLGPDGLTPLPGKPVTITVTNGSASFGACAATACTLISDAAGKVMTSVTPLAAGTITLTASQGNLTRSASFLAAAKPNLLSIGSAPRDGSFVGLAAASPFTARLVAADGVTPVAGTAIVLSAAGGATMRACGAPSCTLTTDNTGSVTTLVSPTAAGVITLTAGTGTLRQSVTFSAAKRPDVMSVMSAPADGSLIGDPAAASFVVRILAADGITPIAGAAVTFLEATGSVRWTACPAPSCVIATDANGFASTAVTPLVAGAITLSASAGPLSATASFVAASKPNLILLISSPASGSSVGDIASSPFAIRIVGPDGHTPVPAQRVSFTVAAGSATYPTCGAPACTADTDANGLASVPVLPASVGTVTLVATAGALTQSTRFTAASKANVLTILSAPANGSLAGEAAAIPFSARVVAADGITPMPGLAIVFAADPASARFAACAAATCTLTTDSNGIASTVVTPVAAGMITLTVTQGTLAQSTSFTSVSKPDTISILSIPANASLVGDIAAQPFTVQLSGGYPSAPLAGKLVTLSVTNAGGSLSACGAASCALLTDASGRASTSVTPTAPGLINLSAAEGAVVATASFRAQSKPDKLVLISAPEAKLYEGAAAPTAFAVRALLADGTTPVAGLAITFSASGPGKITWSACAAPACTLITDASGLAQISLRAASAGTLQLTATPDPTSGAAPVTVALEVDANQMSLTAAAPALYLAEGATMQFTLRAAAVLNDNPAAGLPIQWSGASPFSPLASTSSSDATGSVSMLAQAGPLANAKQASLTACGWTSTCAKFTLTGVGADDYRIALTSGAAQSVSLGTPLQPVLVQLTDALGHLVAAVPVTIYQTVTAFAGPCPERGRCPAAAVLASRVTAVAADASGQISVVPLTVPGVPQQTQIAFSAGTQGVASTTLTTTP